MYYGFMYLHGRPAYPMIRFTFSRGEGENVFVAAGAHYPSNKYENYTITGNWGPPSEDGKIPVELKMAYKTADWADAKLEGVFDPDENSLRGIVVIVLDELTGEFVFKRDPDFVRFYPAPSVINARKRWEFATTSVLDGVRQNAWSTRRILKKIRDGKRYMYLALRGYYGKGWREEEAEEFVNLFPGLYEADAQLYASLINIEVVKTPIFSYVPFPESSM